MVSVNLHARLTEIGTLDLWFSEIGGRRSWRLQFDVRSATQTDVAAHQSQAEGEGIVDEAVWQECRMLIQNTFGRREGQPICQTARRVLAQLDLPFSSADKPEGWPNVWRRPPA